MKSCRIHIMGASGSGVTSLGRALADSLATPHHDTDDYFWRPTIPPYREMREASARLKLMREMFLPRADWVLSGSLNGWGDALIPDFDLVVFLVTPREIRLQRLRAREATRFGAHAVAPGGWRHEETQEFIEWASGYEEGEVSRNLAKHQAWLVKLPCPVLRLDGSRPLLELVDEVRRAIGDQANPR
jgi:adenylate kinase family enzyme